jgi:hypothetical protein
MTATTEKHIEVLSGETLRQTTNTVIMVSPDHFGFNPQTAGDNTFQRPLNQSELDIKRHAMDEWRGVVSLLESKGIIVIQMPTEQGEKKPDAVFPNNWFTHHEGGKLVFYPMRAANRRLERQPLALQAMLQTYQIPITDVLDLSYFENKGQALEGTGSLVLDRVHKVAFAIESPRANKEPFTEFCRQMGYEGIMFHAWADDKPIYHTNVIMSIGSKFAIWTDGVVKDDSEKNKVLGRLQELGNNIIHVTPNQMAKFGANILELQGSHGPVIIASETAVRSYSKDQLDDFAKYGELVPFHMPTIETIGGGSARCILAEVFPNK